MKKFLTVLLLVGLGVVIATAVAPDVKRYLDMSRL
jgi:hypothetical protein